MDEVIYMDDERNAPPAMYARPGVRPRVPGRRTVVVPPGRSPTVVYAPGSSPATYHSAYPHHYNPGYPSNPIFVPPSYSQPLGTFAARFGMSMGELIDSALQILAAITGLPAAPIAQGDAETDTANLVLYQTALAQHAKRDEQLRTIGNLLVRILK